MSERAMKVAREIIGRCRGLTWESAEAAWDQTTTDIATAIDAAGPEWRDISTAPKDGTTIIVYRPVANKFIRHVGIDYWKKIDGIACWARSNSSTPPTMWQPLPSPPQTDATDE